MKDLKNFVITLLSVIIIIQAAFLFHFLRRPQAPVRIQAKPPQEVVVAKPPLLVPKPAPAGPKIVLVLDDWGYNLRNKDFITDNDFHLTISILPFHKYSTEIAELAHKKNKDVIVHMPMEPLHKENYGLEEHTLMVSMDRSTIDQLLDSAFGSVPYAKGINNHMGSKATEDERFMSIIFSYLKNKNCFFLDSFVTSKSVCRSLARKMGIGFTQRDIFIDNESDPAAIRGQVLKLSQKARRQGVAVGIGHDRPATVAVLKEMIPQLENEGFVFVNLSDIINY